MEEKKKRESHPMNFPEQLEMEVSLPLGTPLFIVKDREKVEMEVGEIFDFNRYTVWRGFPSPFLRISSISI